MCLRHLFYCGGEWQFLESGSSGNGGSDQDYVDLAIDNLPDGFSLSSFYVVFEFFGSRAYIQGGPGRETINYGLTYYDMYVIPA